MAIVYVFLEKLSYANGETGSVNNLLEMSAYCRTFSKDVTFRTSGLFKTSFMGVEEATAGELSQMSTVRTALTTRIGDNLASGLPGGAGSVQDKLQSLLGGIVGSNQWTVQAANSSPELDGGDSFPTYFEIKYDLNYTPDPTEEFLFKVWLKDSKFRDEYPLAEFTVVPPIPNPLDFYNAYQTSRNLIINKSLADHVNNAQAFLTGIVTTGYEAVTLRVYNRNNIAEFFDCPWFVGYNGKAGVTYSALITAIKEYLLDLPGSPGLEEWLISIPQLNPIGTYFVVPLWDKVAIPHPNPSNPPEMYSPLIAPNSHTPLANIFAGSYTSQNLLDKGEFATSDYKSIAFFILPSSENDGGDWLKFSQVYTDFGVVHPDDLNTSGISLASQNAIEDLYQLLDEAETYVPPALLPGDMKAENVGGRLFLSMLNIVGGAKLYVMTRAAYLSYLAE